MLTAPPPKIFGFLKGINLGKRRLTMIELAEALTAQGLTGVETFIASGNFVFDGGGIDDLTALETTLEQGLAQTLGFQTDVFVRSRACLTNICAAADATRTVTTISLNIYLLKTHPSPALADEFARWDSPIERFTFTDRAVIWTANDKISQTPFGTKGFQSKTLPSMTCRTANTFQRMLARW